MKSHYEIIKKREKMRKIYLKMYIFHLKRQIYIYIYIYINIDIYIYIYISIELYQISIIYKLIIYKYQSIISINYINQLYININYIY